MAEREHRPIKPSLSFNPVVINGNRLSVKNKPPIENRHRTNESSRFNIQGLKISKIKHQTVNISPDSSLESGDGDEESLFSETCQRIQNSPGLVIAEIMKYQRLIEGRKPVRKKVNKELSRVIAIPSMVLKDDRPLPLYLPFMSFLDKILWL